MSDENIREYALEFPLCNLCGSEKKVYGIKQFPVPNSKGERKIWDKGEPDAYICRRCLKDMSELWEAVKDR